MYCEGVLSSAPAEAGGCVLGEWRTQPGVHSVGRPYGQRHAELLTGAMHSRPESHQRM